MTDHPPTFSSLGYRKCPLPNTSGERLTFLRNEFGPFSDVVFAYGCTMYAAGAIEVVLKMILDLLQDLNALDLKGKGPFKNSILESKVTLGRLKRAFCDHLKGLSLHIPQVFYDELDRCCDYRNYIAHSFWAEYSGAFNGSKQCDEAIMLLAGAVDVFHHMNLELLDVLDEIAKATGHRFAQTAERMRQVLLNKSSYASYQEFLEAYGAASRS